MESKRVHPGDVPTDAPPEKELRSVKRRKGGTERCATDEITPKLSHRRVRGLFRLSRISCRASPGSKSDAASGKFEAIGLVSMKTIGRCKAPTAVIRSMTVEIDPYSDFDRLTVYPR